MDLTLLRAVKSRLVGSPPPSTEKTKGANVIMDHTLLRAVKSRLVGSPPPSNDSLGLPATDAPRASLSVSSIADNAPNLYYICEVVWARHPIQSSLAAVVQRSVNSEEWCECQVP